MKLYPIPAFQDNYIWILIDKEDHALVVDPGDADPVIDYLQQHQLTLTGLLITHHHLDHIGGINKLIDTYGDIPVYGSADNDIPHRSQALKDGDRFTFAPHNLNIQTLAVPGHTLGHIAFFIEDERLDAPILFCGDTLFAGGCGRLFEGTPAQMWQSLERLMQLPEDTLVCCAHEYTLSNLKFALSVLPEDSALLTYQDVAQQQRQQNIPTVPTTIAHEKKTNIFVRANETVVQNAVNSTAQKPANSPVDVFAQLREWKDNF